ncbi:MAG: protein kinase domain-containing protein, partial [Waterburya sp.]
LVELFEQESKILAQLQHLPVAQLNNYFTIIPNNSDKKLLCLVMEKVEGENLKQWLKTHGKLTETLAIDWLKQLMSILTQIHQQHILHRDIKPSNIMIRPDGKLILIDFGTARKLTKTYVEKLEDSDITRIYSPGYTAPEQLQGQAVYRSDLFALGRTFLHLMTGIYPDDLPKTPNKQLIWHEQAPQISSKLKELIDRLIDSSSSERPSELEILERLNSFRNRNVSQPHPYLPLKNWQKSISVILIISMAIAYLIIGIRSLGWLQPMELQAFDHLTQLRPLESPDSRLLLITIDEADIQYQNQQNMSLRWSLADEALAHLLTKIKPYQPRTIGIDIYRDFAVDSDFPNLARELRTSNRLYAVCKVPAPQDHVPSSTPPPPEISLDRIGFSDFVADSGALVRRQLLHLTQLRPLESPDSRLLLITID